MSKSKANNARLLVLAFGGLVLFSSPFRSSSQDQSPNKKSPPQSFAPSLDWRPTQTTAGARFAGSQACAQCHTQTTTQPTTPMARALETAKEGAILREHKLLTFKIGPYSYSITREGDGSVYSVTDGKETISTPILWAFGLGKAGQTYVIQLNGKHYESRVSFYSDIGGLDLTLGATGIQPRSLTEAAGRLMSGAETRDCFSCHATAAVVDGRLQTDKLTPGISCEGCHGPGADHISAMKARDFANSRILNPGRFDTNGQTEFCGACHRTWTQVMLMGTHGIGGVRFQPYRIFGSKCYDFEDRRISCSACHNPHEETRRDQAFYDSKCMACHQTPSRVCKTGKQNCAGCHMPKYELPGAHFKFTDHRIRIVRTGEPYPE
jgi:hypothetical protein